MRRKCKILLGVLALIIPMMANAEITAIGHKGGEGASAIIYLWADQGDDTMDKFSVEVSTSDVLTFKSGTSTIFEISTNGNQTLTAPVTNNIFSVVGYESSYAELLLDADQGDNDADTFRIQASVANTLLFINHTTTIFSLSSAGAMTLADSETLTDASDVLTLAGDDTNCTFAVKGFEKSYARLLLDADEGDDDADSFFLEASTADALNVINHTTTIFSFSSAGVMTLADSETLTDASDALTLAGDDTNVVFAVKGFEKSYAALKLQADESDDSGDDWSIQARYDAANALIIQNDASGSLATVLTIGTNGAVTLTGGLTGTSGLLTGDLTATNATATFNTVSVDNKAGKYGAFMIGNTTQLWFKTNNKTNVIDSDITTGL